MGITSFKGQEERLQFIFVKGWCKWLPIGKKSALLEEMKNAWDECVTMIYVHIYRDWKRLAREDSIHSFSGKNLNEGCQI
jgi:hypothetical protein